MNGSQREYLIQVMRAPFQEEMSAIDATVPDRPNLTQDLFTEALKGKLKLIDKSIIERLLINRAEKGVDIFLSRNYGSDAEISFQLTDIIEVPDDHNRRVEQYKKRREEAKKQKKRISDQFRKIEIKVRLSPPSVLNEIAANVDDFKNTDDVKNMIKKVMR